MPSVDGPTIYEAMPQWQPAYVALLSSPMFERVRELGLIYLPISQARADLGTALQAGVSDEVKQQTVGRAITILSETMAGLENGFTPPENSWIAEWIQLYELGLQLPGHENEA